MWVAHSPLQFLLFSVKLIAMDQSKRILVVEDEQILRDLYVTILKDAEFEVDQAADGIAGFAAMSKGGYDLVILDIMLPGMDGLTILSKLANQSPALPNKIIVVLSNLSRDSAIAQAVSLGARGYMIKSDYTPDQVVSEVKRYLNSTN